MGALRRFVSGIGWWWLGVALSVVTILDAVSIEVIELHPAVLTSAGLAIVLVGAYRLVARRDERILALESEVRSLKEGTHLLVKVPELPAISHMLRNPFLDDVYVANRSTTRTANVRFTLITGDGIEWEGDDSASLPSPAHLNPGSNRKGQVSFRGGDEETVVTQPGIKLKVTDEQTGFEAVIDLPTGPEGVVLRQQSV